MIHVKLLLQYKHVPFQIEVDGLDSDAFDVDHLGKLIDQVKRFIDGMLRDKHESEKDHC